MAQDEEVEAASKVKVQLANGTEVTLAQNRGGTLLATSAASGEAVPIVPLGSLVQDLGCDLTWTRRKGLEIKHPNHGVIKPRVVGKCPLVGEACALDLIRELEELKVAELEMATARTANAIWSWDCEQDWAVQLESFLAHGDRGSQLLALNASDSPFRALTESQKASLAEGILLNDKAGWDYLKAFPVSRQRRKRMLTSQWVVHLYAGPGRGADPILKELDDGRVLLEVDLTRSKAFDMNKFGGVYRGLLWAAATGRVAGIIGAPPCRSSTDTPLILKQLWLTLVAKAAAIRQGEFPVFAAVEGRKLFEAVKGNFGQGWESLREVWPLVLEEMCLEEVAGVIATNLDFILPLECTTSTGAAWTSSFKTAIVEAVRRWQKEPESLQVVKWAKKLDVKGFLEGFTEKELRMWRTHVRNNHTPYNRRCRTCVASSGVGRMHRRVKHPSAHCLSLDVAGPFRQKAADPDHRDYRYMLIGAYTYPKLEMPEGKSGRAKDELKAASDPSGEQPLPDDCQEYAPSGDEAVPPLKCDGDTCGDSLEVGPALEEEEGDVFAEDVEETPFVDDAEDLKGLTQEEFERIFHEVGEEFDMDTFYISRPLRSRTSAEVHAAVQEVFLTLRAEGLHVARVHADRARELRTVPLRRWLLQRGTVSTYTEGQAPQANGRAENAVKWVKAQTKKLLMATSLPRSCWAMASVYATWARRETQLGRGHDVLPFGTPVHVRSKVYGAGGRHDLDSRWRAGVYVGPSLDVRGGHVVRFEDGQFMTSAHLRPHLVDSDKLVDLGNYEAIVLPPTRRIRTKSSLEVAGDADPMDMDVGEHDPEHAAEQYALGLLKEEHLEPDQLEMLAHLLPASTVTPKRFGTVDGQKVWASGAFIHGPFAGLKKSTTAFPFATRVFVKYIRQIAPKHEFNSLAVNINVEARGHKDIHNVGMNMIAALSSFKKGGLEVDGPNGVEVLEVGPEPVFFDPKHTHSTKEWSGGNRVVLLAYSVRDSAKMSEENAARLREIGFVWSPHLSRPEVPVSSALLRTLRVGLLKSPDLQHQGQDPDLQHQGQDPDLQHQGQDPNLQHQGQDPDLQHQGQDPNLQHQGQDPDLQHQGQDPDLQHQGQDPDLQHQGQDPDLQHQGQDPDLQHQGQDPNLQHQGQDPDLQHQGQDPDLQHQGQDPDLQHQGQDPNLQHQGQDPDLQHQGQDPDLQHQGQDPDLQHQGQDPDLQHQGQDPDLQHQGQDPDLQHQGQDPDLQHQGQDPDLQHQGQGLNRHERPLSQESEHPSEPLEHVRQDLDLVLRDLEDRVSRLRTLLEEEEILQEEYRRVGGETREHLQDACGQVSQYLEEVHSHLAHVESLRTMLCLRSLEASSSPLSSSGGSDLDSGEVDYEVLLSSLEEDLQVVHTVPLQQVRVVLDRWTDAIRKEVENLLATGTVRAVTASEIRQMERAGLVVMAPSKCVFTLKPPSQREQRYKRKCRLVICGNFVESQGVDLYAAGIGTDGLRTALVLAAVHKWAAATSDITGAFLLAPWPAHLPRYGVFPPRVVREAGVVGAEAWLIERPLYGLRESPSIWSSYRDSRLKKARIQAGALILVLIQTVAETELWLVKDEVTDTLVGLLVTYVDDILYFGERAVVLALRAFVEEEWPASSLEWINPTVPVRYLGVEVLWDGSSSSFSISQTAYILDLLRAHNMQDVHSTLLPVPREWVEAVENDPEALESDFDESTLRTAQKAVGEALWLATKSRPDILFVVNHMATYVSRQPSHVIRVGQRLLAYLSGTSDMRLLLGPRGETHNEIVCFTDASYASDEGRLALRL